MRCGYTMENFSFVVEEKDGKQEKKEKKRERADLWDHSSRRSTVSLYDSDN